jgi:excisionase family DNA binding protein
MREFLKVSEVCEILGISRRTALRWIYEGKLKAVKLGGGRLWRIRESDLKRFIREGHEPK